MVPRLIGESCTCISVVVVYFQVKNISKQLLTIPLPPGPWAELSLKKMSPLRITRVFALARRAPADDDGDNDDDDDDDGAE